MNKFLRALQVEITRCERNRNRITGDRQRLRTDPAIRAYETAEDEALVEYQSALLDRDQILLVLPRAEAALSVARTRKHPDVQEQRQQPRAIAGSSRPSVSGSRSQGGSTGLSGEVSDLISMGPIARR